MFKKWAWYGCTAAVGENYSNLEIDGESVTLPRYKKRHVTLDTLAIVVPWGIAVAKSCVLAFWR